MAVEEEGVVTLLVVNSPVITLTLTLALHMVVMVVVDMEAVVMVAPGWVALEEAAVAAVTLMADQVVVMAADITACLGELATHTFKSKFCHSVALQVAASGGPISSF